MRSPIQIKASDFSRWKFWGHSIQHGPVGVLTEGFDYEEIYEWSRYMV